MDPSDHADHEDPSDHDDQHDGFEMQRMDFSPRAPASRAVRAGRRVAPLTLGAVCAGLAALLVLWSVLDASGHASRGATHGAPNTTSMPNLAVPTIPSGWSTPNPATVALPPVCQTSDVPHTIEYLIAPAFGGTPVWVTGFDEATAHPVIHFESLLPRQFTLRGWAWEAIFVTNRAYTGPVTISGGSVDGRSPVLFGVSDTPGPALALDPRSPASQLGDWGEWATYAYVPGPGCYYVEARWPGGGWRVTFAAGR
jgi:hypothetical protein